MHFIKRDEVDRRAAGRAGRPPASRPPTARAATRWRRPSSRARSAAGHDRLRALLGHLARPRVILPSPSSPDRVAGRLSSAASTAGPRRPAAPRSRTARASRWRQYREIWAYVEGDELSPARDPAPLRRSLPSRAAARRAPPAATSATRAWCPSCRRPPWRRWPTSTTPSSRWLAAPGRPWAAPRAPRSSTARAPRRSSATPTTACPPTAPPPTCAEPTSSRAWTS